MVARGAKRPRSELRGLLQAFQPLTLSWAGTAELKTLVKAEWRGGLPLPAGAALLCGFYLNELLLKLLPREDPHPRLLDELRVGAAALTADAGRPRRRRCCATSKCACSRSSGYALPLTHDVDTGAPVDAAARYHYAFDRGPRRRRRRAASTTGRVVRGATLIALATRAVPGRRGRGGGETTDAATCWTTTSRSGGIFSRRVVQDLAALEDDKDMR